MLNEILGQDTTQMQLVVGKEYEILYNIENYTCFLNIQIVNALFHGLKCLILRFFKRKTSVHTSFLKVEMYIKYTLIRIVC